MFRASARPNGSRLRACIPVEKLISVIRSAKVRIVRIRDDPFMRVTAVKLLIAFCKTDYLDELAALIIDLYRHPAKREALAVNARRNQRRAQLGARKGKVLRPDRLRGLSIAVN